MMNKYTLGTIVSTALLGLAKSKLGSGAKLKLVYKETLKGLLHFGLNDDVTDFDQNTLSRIREAIESYGLIFESIDFTQDEIPDQDVGGLYYNVFINIHEDYYSENNANILGGLAKEIELLIEDYLYPDDYTDVSSEKVMTKYLLIQNQDGEWVPYVRPKSTRTNVRKR